MTDLIERLRTRPTGDPHLHALVHEAADEIERRTKEAGLAWSEVEKRDAEIQRLTKERDALRLDAERWRWWREQVKFPGTRTAAQAMLWNCSFSRSKFDALTDAAMKEKLCSG